VPMSAEPTRKAKPAAAFRSVWYMFTLFIFNHVNGIPLGAVGYGIYRAFKFKDSANDLGKIGRCVVSKTLLRPSLWFRL